MANHACLREREGHEGADGEEWDESIGDAAEGDEDERGKDREDDDAFGVDKAAAADREELGEIAVFGDGAAETREVGEGGVGGKRKQDEDARNRDVVHDALAGYGGGDHAEQALVLR